MNTREAAARLHLPPREVYRLIDVGALVASVAGRDLRLRIDDVDAFDSTSPSSETPDF